MGEKIWHFLVKIGRDWERKHPRQGYGEMFLGGGTAEKITADLVGRGGGDAKSFHVTLGGGTGGKFSKWKLQLKNHLTYELC